MSESALHPISENVIIFPRNKYNVPPMTVEELKENIIASKMEVSSFLAEELTREIYRIMSDNGYNITNVQDLGFLLLVIKAIIFRHEKIEHPVQKLIDENMLVEQ